MSLSIEKATDNLTSYSIELCKSVIAEKLSINEFFDNSYPEYYYFIDKAIESFNDTATLPITCSINCGFCCYELVSISPLEAAYLQYQLKKIFSAIEIEEMGHAIYKRYKKQQNIMKKFPGDSQRQGKEYSMQKLPCQFLTDDQQCMIYNFRPTVCRNLNVVTPSHFCDDVELCKKILIWRHPSVWKIDMKIQKFISKFYLGLENYDLMQALMAECN